MNVFEWHWKIIRHVLQADLADRDFTAERHQAVVISMGAVDPIAAETSAAERAAAETRNQHKLSIPRRPAWDAATTPEQLEAQEKQSFLEWRRYVLLAGLSCVPYLYQSNLQGSYSCRLHSGMNCMVHHGLEMWQWHNQLLINLVHYLLDATACFSRFNF